MCSGGHGYYPLFERCATTSESVSAGRCAGSSVRTERLPSKQRVGGSSPPRRAGASFPLLTAVSEGRSRVGVQENTARSDDNRRWRHEGRDGGGAGSGMAIRKPQFPVPGGHPCPLAILRAVHEGVTELAAHDRHVHGSRPATRRPSRAARDADRRATNQSRAHRRLHRRAARTLQAGYCQQPL